MTEENILQERLNAVREATTQWQRLHELSHKEHEGAHSREHTFTETAIGKAEATTDKAISAAKEANDERFKSVNEFRATLSDASTRFATQASLVASEKSMLEKMDSMEKQIMNRIEADIVRASEERAQGRKRIEALELSSQNMAGRLWMLGSTIAFVIVVVNVLIKFL